ncbi:MAG: ferrous iron transporter B [Planctomycetota bacterium]
MIEAPTRPLMVALVGNPNVGKTSLFNRLTRSFGKTSNFSGTTVEVRSADLVHHEHRFKLIDLPGTFSLGSSSPEEKITREFLEGDLDRFERPDVTVVVVDACNLERSLFLVQQLQRDIPLIVAVNMVDRARQLGVKLEAASLEARLACPVVMISSKTGEGMESLLREVAQAAAATHPPQPLPVLNDCGTCHACPYAEGYAWSASVAADAVAAPRAGDDRWTLWADKILTHAVTGTLLFAAIMLGVFISIFSIAQYPMELLDGFFATLSSGIAAVLPAGLFSELLTDGVLAGVGSVLIFLPQIAVLFFLLTLLEDCGYLSRAVLLVDRAMRRAGLPGQAFVPMLAAHACAIPAIMSTRIIQNRRDRLAAIMVMPLMTCSARLPVYTMIAAMLFPEQPVYAALLFAGAYSLGIITALVVSLVLRWTILPGKPAPLLLDLPPFRRPSLVKAGGEAVRRCWMFIRDAGTVILCISVVIWATSTFPRASDEQLARMAQAHAGEDVTSAQLAQEYSVLGRAGKWVQPLFAPLGYDWKTSVGVLSSFAAREVVVSTMSVLYGADEEGDSIIERITAARHPDGTKVFDVPTCVSLLVFFVLAMQCLPTQAVTRKETGSWKWAAFQLGYMTLLAYGAAFTARWLTAMLL